MYMYMYIKTRHTDNYSHVIYCLLLRYFYAQVHTQSLLPKGFLIDRQVPSACKLTARVTYMYYISNQIKSFESILICTLFNIKFYYISWERKEHYTRYIALNSNFSFRIYKWEYELRTWRYLKVVKTLIEGGRAKFSSMFWSSILNNFLNQKFHKYCDFFVSIFYEMLKKW